MLVAWLTMPSLSHVVPEARDKAGTGCLKTLDTQGLKFVPLSPPYKTGQVGQSRDKVFSMAWQAYRRARSVAAFLAWHKAWYDRRRFARKPYSMPDCGLRLSVCHSVKREFVSYGRNRT